VGHHSTSDDSTKYRPVDEIEWWRSARDPVARFRKWIESNGWWCSEAESELTNNVREQVKIIVSLDEISRTTTFLRLIPSFLVSHDFSS
jgi:2-oxoisovalerate dehydrogenase E1 component alpha subunit